MSTYSKEYYQKNKERMNQQSKDWQAKNPEKTREVRKKHYDSGKGKAARRLWVEKNKEKIKAIKNAYKDKHYSEPNFWITTRISQWRSKDTGVKSNLTTKYLLDLLDKQGGLCYYTNEKLVWGARVGKTVPNSASLDRLIPDRGYVQGNVVWCSFFANTMKGKLTEAEFYEYIKKIIKVRGI
jgi:hypothetical protein